MRITTGGKRLLDSKTFMTLDAEEATVEVDEGDGLIRIVFKFIDDGNKRSAGVNWHFVDSTTLKLDLINWNNTNGTILTNPAYIGTYLSKPLYITFSVYMIQPNKLNQRIVTMALYLDEKLEAQNANN